MQIDTADHREQAAQLNTATQAGDMHKAFSLIRSQSPEGAAAVLLLAGFPVIRHQSRDFWTYVQKTLATACLSHSTGHEVR